MGMFRVVLEATGGHGCQREVKDGGMVFGCRRQDCPDCVTQEFFDKMRVLFSDTKGEFIHWPGQSCEVRDEFVPLSKTVQSYKASQIVDGEIVETDEVKYYINEVPSHRIRHGNF